MDAVVAAKLSGLLCISAPVVAVRVNMAKSGLLFGEEVIIPWGLDEVRGRVHEVYGTPPLVQVVVELTPELSGSIVDETTTVTMPLDAVKRVAPAS